MKRMKYNQLSKQYQWMIDEAALARERGFSPFSHYKVGAALMTKDGRVINGANYETTMFMATHAEQAALASANRMGYRTFKAVGVIGRHEKRNSTEVTVPCGFCRQYLFEASPKMTVVMSSPNKEKIIISSINELLPLAFGLKT